MAQNYDTTQDVLDELSKPDANGNTSVSQDVLDAIKDLTANTDAKPTVLDSSNVNDIKAEDVSTEAPAVVKPGAEVSADTVQVLAQAPVVMIADSAITAPVTIDTSTTNVQQLILAPTTATEITLEGDKGVSVTLQSGDNTIKSTGNSDDVIDVKAGSATLTLEGGNNTISVAGNATDVTTIKSEGTGKDVVSVESGNANVTLAGSPDADTPNEVTLTGGVKHSVTLEGGSSNITIGTADKSSAPQETVKITSAANAAAAVTLNDGALDFTTAGAITLLEVTGGKVTVDAGDSTADNNFALAGGVVTVTSGSGNDTVELTGGVTGTVDLSAGGDNTVTLATQNEVTVSTGTGNDTVTLTNIDANGNAFKLGNVELNNHGGDLKVDLDASVLANPDNYGTIKIDGAASGDAASGFTQIHMRDNPFHHFFDFVRDTVTGIRHFFMHSEGQIELANMDVIAFDTGDVGIKAGEDNVTVLASNDQDVLVAKFYQLMRGADGVIDGGDRVAQAEAADGANHGLDGINFWMNAFEESNVTTPEGAVNFAYQFFGSSDEFSSKFDTMNSNDFVHQMYANIGADNADHTAAMNNYIKQLDSGALDKVQVTLQIAENELNPDEHGQIRVIGLDGQDYSLVAGIDPDAQ